MKKLINSPEDVVRDALRGMEAAHGDRLRISYDPYLVVRKDAPVQGKVGIISGGGSGHEPMHGGFVGPGMLDAACPGEVFTSPTPDQMLEATKAVNGGAGVLHVVKNYTGDVMNFDMAADMGKGEDIEVETVLTNDDVAVEDSLYTAGRRGVGVTVLVEKICGAAADDGKSLAEVAELGRKVNANGRSMGMALTPCITPGSGEPSFELADDEVEIGIGIHGEPGRFREHIGPASQIAERLMTPILEDLPFSSGDNVLAFVNGMGGTPLLELYVVYAEVAKIAQEHGLSIERNLIGNYITSLEMQGCSITLVKLDDDMVRYWDAPVDTPALALGLVGQCRSTATPSWTGCAASPARWASTDRSSSVSTRRSATATTAPTWTAACARRWRRSRQQSSPTPAPCSRPWPWRSSRASVAPRDRCTERCSCRWEVLWPGRNGSTCPAGPPRGAQAWRACRRAARRSPTTRRWSTRSSQRSRRSKAPRISTTG